MAEPIPTKRSHNFQDLTGRRFGRLLVVGYAGRTREGNSLWHCLCDCGGEKTTKTSNLTAGETGSCGCAMMENLRIRNTPKQKIEASGKIILAGGHVCLVDPDDVLLISGYSWHAAKSHNGLLYARSGAPEKVMMHVLLMGSRGVDHKNRNGLDNRRGNLRLATASQNQGNRPKLATSMNRYKGVVRPRNRCTYWQYQICINGKQTKFGRFATEDDAAKAYDAKAKEVFGEFAFLNFPEEGHCQTG